MKLYLYYSAHCSLAGSVLLMNDCVTSDNSSKEAVTRVQPQLSFPQRLSDEGRANYRRGVGGT